MVTTIPRRNRVHRHTSLQAFRNDLRLDLVRPSFLAVGPYLHTVVPEKLHRSRIAKLPPNIQQARSRRLTDHAEGGAQAPLTDLRLSPQATGRLIVRAIGPSSRCSPRTGCGFWSRRNLSTSGRGMTAWLALAIFVNLYTPPVELIDNRRPGLVESGPPASQGPDKPRRSICDNQARNRSRSRSRRYPPRPGSRPRPSGHRYAPR
jgi:hypothetical protein